MIPSITQNKITSIAKFDTRNLVVLAGGCNMGCAVGIVHEKHISIDNFDLVHMKDTMEQLGEWHSYINE
jgi:ribosomal protein S4E